MMLIDSNILIDVLSNDPDWLDWSVAALDQRGALGVMLVNEVIFAELSVRMQSETELVEALNGFNVEFARTPTQALFVAGKTYRRYREAGGTRTGVLPDFFIGAHAQIVQCPILTRDVRRYRTYFPDVELITPNG
jgi:predicted nucleic acid-binding protein